MTKEQQQVLDFHRTFELPIQTSPTIPSLEECGLRIDLIVEESWELAKALDNKDIIEVADGLGDLLYVVLGCAITCGIDLEPIFQEVHRSNMTKVGGYKREDGKWMKPATYSPPNLAPILGVKET